jgi:hypothetical protein
MDTVTWRKFSKTINKIAEVEEGIAFTLFGFKEGNKDLTLYQFLSVISFLCNNQYYSVYLFYINEMDGFYWNQLRKRINFVRISNFEFYKLSRFHHYAHKSDIVRLKILNVTGGIYFDIDTFTVGDVGKIINSDTAMMGLEQNPVTNEINGICNAVISAPRHNSFISKWISSYSYFYSKGRDRYWGEHSIQLPYNLSKKRSYRESITVLKPEELFSINWYQLTTTVFSDFNAGLWSPNMLSPIIHLWESLTVIELDRISESYILESSEWYAVLSRKYIRETGSILKY